MSPQQKQYSIFGMQIFQTIAAAILIGIGTQLFIWVKDAHHILMDDHNKLNTIQSEYAHTKEDVKNLILEDNKQNIRINTIETQLKIDGTKANPF